MFCDPESAMFPEAQPREASSVEVSQNILLSRGPSK